MESVQNATYLHYLEMKLREGKLTQAIDSIESKLSNTGRILVRESGTEPLIRVMVESADHDFAVKSAEDLAEIIKSK